MLRRMSRFCSQLLTRSIHKYLHMFSKLDQFSRMVPGWNFRNPKLLNSP